MGSTGTPDIIIKKINALKTGSALGPDGFSVSILQALSNEISKPLSMIFDKSFAEGTVPADWRDANISPIFKKGVKGSVSNYRPVSLTSIVCKLMESVIRDQVVDHLSDSLILDSQRGFR